MLAVVDYEKKIAVEAELVRVVEVAEKGTAIVSCINGEDEIIFVNTEFLRVVEAINRGKGNQKCS
jgi:hypothetical protein